MVFPATLRAVNGPHSQPPQHGCILAGAVAQLGERLVRNEEVRGSTPLGSTSLHRSAAGLARHRQSAIRQRTTAADRRLPTVAARCPVKAVGGGGPNEPHPRARREPSK